MAAFVLVLRMTHGEKGFEKTLDVAHLLDPLGHIIEPLFNQGLDIFTDSGVPIVE